MFWINVEQVHQLKIPFCEWIMAQRVWSKWEEWKWILRCIHCFMLWCGVCEGRKPQKGQVLQNLEILVDITIRRRRLLQGIAQMLRASHCQCKDLVLQDKWQWANGILMITIRERGSYIVHNWQWGIVHPIMCHVTTFCPLNQVPPQHWSWHTCQPNPLSLTTY